MMHITVDCRRIYGDKKRYVYMNQEVKKAQYNNCQAQGFIWVALKAFWLDLHCTLPTPLKIKQKKNETKRRGKFISRKFRWMPLMIFVTRTWLWLQERTYTGTNQYTLNLKTSVLINHRLRNMKWTIKLVWHAFPL